MEKFELSEVGRGEQGEASKISICSARFEEGANCNTGSSRSCYTQIRTDKKLHL